VTRSHTRPTPAAVVIHVLTYLAVILFISPFLWMILTSFKTEIQAYELPPLLVFRPTIAHYLSVFYSSNFWFYFNNSAWAAFGSAIISIVLGTIAGYAMVQLPRKSASNVMFFILSTRFMPAAAIVVPLYIIFLKVHLLDTHAALIIVYTALDLPIVTWMARSYFADIPAEIFESARVDGASVWRVLSQVALPLARPGLWAAGLLAVVFSWNEFFFAVNFTYTQAPTLPVLVSSFMTTQGLYWARLSALDTVVVTLPVVLGLIAQRHLVRGLTAGAVK
jgi:sorbitol/mannitol transport system permease protein